LNKRIIKFLIIFILLLFEIGFAQGKNPTVYPYGGVQDGSRFNRIWMERIPLNFKTANFDNAQFNKVAFFEWAQFQSRADFFRAKFHSRANFVGAKFNSLAYFWGADFDNLANFGVNERYISLAEEGVQFHDVADFGSAQFHNGADFERVQFHSLTVFSDDQFYGWADFQKAQFHNRAKFERAQFHSRVDFDEAQFHSRVDFMWAQFHSEADFDEAQFDSLAYFGEAQFHSEADFKEAQFDSLVYFHRTQFHSQVDFAGANFFSLADFAFAKFDSLAYFGGVFFLGQADFGLVKFHSRANFRDVKFHKRAEFGNTQFDSLANFERAEFHSVANFMYSEFNNLAIADFMSAWIIDTVFVGAPRNIQRFDFSLAKLFPGAKIVIYAPVKIKIQHEKLHFISLPNDLDYFSKKVIVEGTKKESFKEDGYAKARFELDYIFAKSTMYQKQSPYYERYSALNPICWGRFLYNITMGLGYRPFRLAWWVLGLIASFAIFYFLWIPQQINNYISKKYEIKESSNIKRKRIIKRTRNPHFTDTIINCLYFSSLLFFTFRLKGDILTFFDTKEKRVIVSEYLIGLLIYISFLTLAKSGSILHTLKSLFVG